MCTENLTPWLKLLPCKSQLGLGSVLHPLKIYASLFHSYTVHVRRVANGTLELTQSLSVVFRSQAPALGKRGMRSVCCCSLFIESAEFSLKAAFGNEPTTCPSASLSKMCVQNAFALRIISLTACSYLLRTPLTPAITVAPQPVSTGGSDAWTLSRLPLALRLTWADTPLEAPRAPGVERHLLGSGQRIAKLRTSVANPLPIGLYFTYHETYAFNR